jgi:hypothetical protein
MRALTIYRPVMTWRPFGSVQFVPTQRCLEVLLRLRRVQAARPSCGAAAQIANEDEWRVRQER